jgi:CRP/FNR family transcriptional regulator, cyclic AMP receptor protein
MARSDSKLDHLAQMWLFTTCSKRELGIIGRASDEIVVPAGKVLCEEGTLGHEFFLILSGQASVRRNGRKIAALGPGEYFGELSLLSRGPRNATVAAEEPMKLLVLGQREFAGVLDEIPALAHKLLTVMAGRLRDADSRALSN